MFYFLENDWHSFSINKKNETNTCKIANFGSPDICLQVANQQNETFSVNIFFYKQLVCYSWEILLRCIISVKNKLKIINQLLSLWENRISSVSPQYFYSISLNKKVFITNICPKTSFAIKKSAKHFIAISLSNIFCIKNRAFFFLFTVNNFII